MDFRRLHYFATVAEERHITRAAARLGMQQPPLSQQIKALEAEVDAKLFLRTPQGVELTEVGEALYEDARRILRDVERAKLRVQRAARGELGRLVVGVTNSTPFHPVFSRIIRLYREAHPKVALEMKDAGSAELLDELEGDQIDVAFVRTRAQKREGVALYDICEEEMRLALPAEHPFAADGRAPLKLKRLSGDPFIMYRRESGAGLYDAIIRACAAEGFTPQIAQEAPWVGATLNFVAAGMGISIVPASLARITRLEGVVYRRLSCSASLTAPIVLACRRGDLSATARTLTALARAEGKAWREDRGDA